MIEGLTAILGRINAQGALAGSLAAVLLAGVVWQGCEHRAADKATERIEARYLIAVEQGARWKVNAEDWRAAANRCNVQTESMRQATIAAQDDLVRELRTARAERFVSQAKFDDLKRRLDEGTLSVRELLAEVQGL